MLLFWIAAAALAVAAALFAAGRGAAAARRAQTPAPDPALAVHRRQLDELDGLHASGLLGDEELQAARAEAGRRLLAAADRKDSPERPGGRGSRLLVTLGAAGAALAALGLYLAVGRPGLGDQPYRARVAGWRAQDPSALDPAQLAAVMRDLAVERPADPKLYAFLGQAEMASGDAGEAAAAFAKAARLAPTNADYPAAAAEALIAGGEGKVPPEAEALFREALRRDPRNATARYQLARLEVSRGRAAAGVAAWRGLLAELAADDPRRAELEAEIAAAEGPRPPAGPARGPGGAPSLAQVAAAARAAPTAGPEQQAFIRGMVDRLASRLATKPDDAEGWARLVRAYGVLGDREAQAEALTRARTAFARKPADLARIEAAAR